MKSTLSRRSIQSQARQIIEITVASLALAGTVGIGSAVHAQTMPASPAAKPADARPADATPEAAFKRADVDADNKLSPAEAAKLPGIGQHFKALDTDKNGSLSADEFMAGYKASTGQ